MKDKQGFGIITPMEKSSKKQSSERRKHKRYQANAEAELFNLSLEIPRSIGKGAVTDISLGGLRFESNVEFAPNNVLIKFSLPGDKKLYSIKCIRVRARKEPNRLIYGLKIYEARVIEKLKLWLYILACKTSSANDF